ncbi:phosphoserine phosphatase [Veronia pacifica]|uniref:Phosphoserine phosphatase n=1 Tax=Veronia pacifica TaxID=1080227 RepID=A0A1C3EK63_9GAMM|nr:phosphoserine phosphatase [Veronia pacifica]ODA33619.1 phosphoserine phosphatase SerB [Veronia pacifica]
MDAFKPYPLKKQSRLYRQFPSLRRYNPFSVKQAGWILFGPSILPSHLEHISFYLGEDVEPVAGWTVADHTVLLMPGTLNPDIEEICQAIELDYASVDCLPELDQPGLAVFDMDSTAIQIECIDEIAALAGVGEQVSEVTERAMQGELDFEQSLRERVAALKGADMAILTQVRDSLPLMPGMGQLVATLKHFGWKVAIASGGFTWFSDKLKQDLQLDHAESNQLVIDGNVLSGELTGNIVDAQRKADILRELADKFDIPATNTIAVGDGANDLVMMASAGLGIAFHAKPKVEAQAQAAVRFSDLVGVACILSASLIKTGQLSLKG